MASTTRQEWLNGNAYRAFPFVENSDFSCKNGLLLPLGLVLDARACIFGTSSATSVTMKSAVVTTDGITATFEYDGTEYKVSGYSNVIETQDDFSIRVTFCDKDKLEELVGEYVLSTPATLLASRVLTIPYGIGVDTLTCGDVTATNVIRVVNGHNTELDIHSNNLRLRIQKGLGDGVICQDVVSEVCEGAVLYYLNGQKADSDGSIWIKGGDGVSVSSGTYKGIPAVFVSTSATINSFMYK